MGLVENIKDVAKIVQQSDNLGLYRQLIDLSEQALNQQNTINSLNEENERLRKKLKDKKNVQRHSELYLVHLRILLIRLL